jgi:hypothetical protein
VKDTTRQRLEKTSPSKARQDNHKAESGMPKTKSNTTGQERQSQDGTRLDLGMYSSTNGEYSNPGVMFLFRFRFEWKRKQGH